MTTASVASTARDADFLEEAIRRRNSGSLIEYLQVFSLIDGILGDGMNFHLAIIQ